MNATVARLTASVLLGRRRAVLLLLLPLVLLALAAIARMATGIDPGMAVGLLGGFALGTIVPLLGLIAGTGAIGPEIDDGSIVYLLSKPLNRHTIVTSKLAVAVTVVLTVAAVPTLIAGVILSGSWGRIAFGFAAAAATAGIAYAALFLLLAVLTRNAVVAGLLYALLWESLIGGFAPGAQAVSIRQWSLAITVAILGSDAAGLGVSSAVDLVTGVVLLVIVTVGSTWYAGHRLRSLRPVSSE